MTLLAFILGIMGTIFAIYVAVILHEKSKPAQKNQGPSDAEKLETARNRLGQITTLESIKMIRKIAHKAMKETQ
jgi:H+/gluconate symporter-like permease